jgi:hypothetical protein
MEIGRDSRNRIIKMAAAVIYVGVLNTVSGGASAAIIYNSSLEQWSANNVYATGGAYLYDSYPIAGGGEIVGEVSMTGTQITVRGVAYTGAGTQAGIDSRGEWQVNDLIFTDIGNPGASGTISVAANFFLGFTPAVRMIVQSGIHTTGFALNQQFNGTASTGVSTAFVNVPLNTLISFSATADLRVTDTTGSNGQADSAIGYFQLADIPFFLPEGYTVNSIDAGITNNSLLTSIQAPAAFPLLLAGVAGIGWRRRRKSG